MDKEKDKYYSLEKSSEAIYREKGSKFIAYSRQVGDKFAFDLFMSEIKSKHPKARHFCFAYKLDPEGLKFRSSDDGEPSGSAGKPILGQLIHFKLSYAGVIVVRYFGGTKLGVSGLIEAYKTSSRDSILNNNIIEKYETDLIQIKFEYDKMGVLLNIIKDLDLIIASQNFNENPSIVLELRRSRVDLYIRKVVAKLLNRPLGDVDKNTQVEGIIFETYNEQP